MTATTILLLAAGALFPATALLIPTTAAPATPVRFSQQKGSDR